MKRLYILLLAIVVLGVGCQTAPRYRSGQASRPGDESGQSDKKINERRYSGNTKAPGLNSSDLLELGRIVQKYLGRPYAGSYHGKKGIDCSQLIQDVFRKFNNTKLPRTVAKQFKSGLKINKEHLRFGDLVFFRTNGSGASHVGIYVENDEFVHASSSNGVIISSMDEEYWKKRLLGCRRILE